MLYFKIKQYTTKNLKCPFLSSFMLYNTHGYWLILSELTLTEWETHKLINQIYLNIFDANANADANTYLNVDAKRPRANEDANFAPEAGQNNALIYWAIS